jgi:RNA polymerase sigma factor (sigma-70 family)
VPTQSEIDPPATTGSTFNERKQLVMQSVQRHDRYLRNYLYGMTKSWPDADDLAQDLWRYVIRSFADDQIASLPLLRYKAYQLFVDFYRRNLRRSETSIEAVAQIPDQPSELSALSKDEEAALEKAFWEELPGIGLTKLQRKAIWLKARFGMTIAEISEQLDVPRSTLGDWITLAREQIRDHLDRSN